MLSRLSVKSVIPNDCWYFIGNTECFLNCPNLVKIYKNRVNVLYHRYSTWALRETPIILYILPKFYVVEREFANAYCV